MSPQKTRLRAGLVSLGALSLTAIGALAPMAAQASTSTAEVIKTPRSVYVSDPPGIKDDRISVTVSYKCYNDYNSYLKWNLFGEITRDGMTPFYMGNKWVGYNQAKCTGEKVTETFKFKSDPYYDKYVGVHTFMAGKANLRFGLTQSGGYYTGDPVVKTTTNVVVPKKAYPSCKSLNAVYLHGVGKKGARDKTQSTRVTNFFVSNTIYAMNDGRVKSKKQYDLDPDNDGIACEKR